MKIQFIGATHEVTGSCTLLEVGGRYYMVDCGMEQGTDVFQNIPLPVPAGAIEAVFLTHAHIDHSGMLPKLCKDGFSGPIYATEATCDLCNIMLRDSAHIQESEVQWRNRKAERSGEPLVEPTYTMNDAMAAIKLLRPVRYQELLQVAEGIDLQMTDIGHLLGSAAIELWLTENGETRKIVFSGDVGNTNQPLLNDPKTVEETDYLVIESTYGDRFHSKARGDAEAELSDCIQRAFDRGGNLVIPSFAVGRTQEMLYLIREIKQKGLVTGHDGFPVYVDSPLAVEATGIFLQSHESNFAEETRGDVIAEFAGYLQRALDRGGNVVIPSFAVGRTQEMLYAIREIKQKGLVKGHDGFPVYVDSPLAVEATGIFLQSHESNFDPETLEVIRQGVNPIWSKGVTLSVTSEESKLINADLQPKVILSASGMCEAGRIRHHLKHNLWRKESIVLFVGYQAEHSLGRKLQEGVKNVKLFGEDIAVHAEIATLHGTSGHADKEGLLNWLLSFREKPKLVFVNHGDDDSCEAFRKTLEEMGYRAEAPYSGTEYDLLTGKLTAYTEGVKIDRAAAFKGSQRARQVYGELLAAAEALLALVRTRRGCTNKDNAKLTAQIRSLIEKWK